MIPGGHKWLHYFEAYQEVFDLLRSRPIRMLEIGVYHGASLAMWRRYLHPDSVIVGIDIDPTCARFEAADRHLHVRIGSQADPVFLAGVVTEFGPFDVILDDGSHVCSHMITSFDELFLAGLRDDGLYIAEDTHTNFWPEFRDQPYSFIDLCKDLVDYMHWHHIVMPHEINYRLGLVDDRPGSLSAPHLGADPRDPLSRLDRGDPEEGGRTLALLAASVAPTQPRPARRATPSSRCSPRAWGNAGAHRRRHSPTDALAPCPVTRRHAADRGRLHRWSCRHVHVTRGDRRRLRTRDSLIKYSAS